MKRTQSISNLFAMSTFGVAFAVCCAMAAIVVITDYREFRRNADLFETESSLRRDAALKSVMDQVANLIEFERANILSNLKDELRQRVDEAHDIAWGIYSNNKGLLPEKEVTRLILDALGGVRFFEGRGYYWIHDLKHTLVMNPFRPGMVGSNDFELTDLSGKKIVQSFVAIGAGPGQGFDIYYWNKPGQSVLLPKLSYLRRFDPFGWVIGAGEYFDDVDLRVQQSILRRLALLHPADDVTFLILDFNGNVVFDLSGVNASGSSLLQVRDRAGRSLVHAVLSEGLKAGGGFGTFVGDENGMEGSSIAFHSRTVPGWGWVMAVSAPQEATRRLVDQQRAALRETMLKQLFFALATLAAVALGVFALASRVSHHLRDELSIFMAFFGRVAKGGAPIDVESLSMSELRNLALSANLMGKELAKSRNDILAKTMQLMSEVETRRKAQEELSHARDSFRDMLDSMPSLVVGVDDQGMVTHWNRSAGEITQIRFEDALGKPLAEALPQLAPHMAVVEKSLACGKPAASHGLSLRLREEMRQADLLVYPLVSGGVRGAVIRLDDVTERMRVDELLAQTEKVMSVGGLAAGMAHEINNPLSGIMQSAQVILRRLDPANTASQEEARSCGVSVEAVLSFLEKRRVLEMLDGIRDAASRAGHIVANMLDFSRKTEAIMAPADLRELLERSVELCSKDYDLKKQYDFRSIAIEWDLDADLGPVFCSPSRLEQVFMNLLRNAAQAMHGNPDQMSPRIVLRTRSEDGFARVEVEDNGPGMDEATRRRIFEPFFSTKPPGEGTGLGLSVSFFIVTHLHGGTLHVESEPGRRTTFVIRLPLRQGGQALGGAHA